MIHKRRAATEIEMDKARCEKEDEIGYVEELMWCQVPKCQHFGIDSWLRLAGNEEYRPMNA
jgi:hypothetical protein